MKRLKFILWLIVGWFLFPEFNNGVINFIFKFFFFIFLMSVINIIINDGINWIDKNWKKIYLKYIDEREHVRGNTLAKVTRIGFIGGILRVWHHTIFNRKKYIQGLWYNYLENVAIWITAICFILIIIAFILFAKYFY